MYRVPESPPPSIRRNLLGLQFGDWKVIGYVGRRRGNTYWLCQCTCGRTKEVSSSNLTRGNSKQCKSCAMRKRPHPIKHGHSGSRTYRCWHGLRDTKAHVATWSDFLVFLADMGECPQDHRLHRLDPRRPYGPDNCCWVPRALVPDEQVVEELRTTRDWLRRNMLVRHLHATGCTYQQIADILSVSRQRIQQILYAPMPNHVTGRPRWKAESAESSVQLDEAIVALHQQGATMQAISERLGLPRGAVGSRVRRLIREGKILRRRALPPELFSEAGEVAVDDGDGSVPGEAAPSETGEVAPS